MPRSFKSEPVAGKPHADDGGSDLAETRAAATLVRGIRVLEAFRSSDNGPLSNKEVAERTGLPKATVSRLIHALADMGYVAIDPKSGGYSLGPGVLSFAHIFLSQLDIRLRIRPLMQRLSAPPGTTLLLAVRDRFQMTTVEAMENDPGFQLRAWVGASVPIALTASGHAYLAGLSPAARTLLLEKMSAEHTDGWRAINKSIDRSLRSVAANGYCFERGEWKPHLSEVAVPVALDLNRDNVLSFVCGGPPKLLPEKKLEQMGLEMVECARELERFFKREL
ncbi:putative IclR family transcriptional regulator [Paraburkholderia unamae]|uniref:IclR family transcriptional regulator n=1 Tax=Paraburkholderia unamae TaxID=219649 RepID=UPI001CB0CE20|nr:IclR family transcriptional regulator [Paraburkholderia unamae]CAG9246080.1 putative IclR family transcriptional regulator [Paraburkholderia unamae]